MANVGCTWGPTGPSWAPCWPHELCYLGLSREEVDPFIDFRFETKIFNATQ